MIFYDDASKDEPINVVFMDHSTDNTNKTHMTIVNQGVDYIIDHLFDKLTVDMIADHCCFSRYYYNRLFKSVTGENVYGFIKRLRLETAAFKLIKFPHLSITSVAAELGYSASNFSVLFKEHYGLSPSRFRSGSPSPLEPQSHAILERIRNLQKNKPRELLKRMDQCIAFKELPDIKVVYKRFKGNYRNLPAVWQAFCQEMGVSSSDSPIGLYGISYDDPLIAGEDKCLYDLCAEATESTLNKGKNVRKILGGTYLCYRFDDHVEKLSQIYHDLFAVWMPHRGYIMGPGLCFERYYADSTPGGHIVMDICVPVFNA